MTGKNVVILSNGHGEDAIGATIAAHLLEEARIRLRALPIVGRGRAYRTLGIPLLMKGFDLPSGGFARNGIANLLADLRAGLFGLTVRQIDTLRRVRQDTDLAVCAGDVFLVLLAGLFLRRPVVFIPTAKSDYIAPHWRIETTLMRRFCRAVFPRDALTAASLVRRGIPADYLGNVMMDCLEFSSEPLRGENASVVGILPGSRQDAYTNLEDIAPVIPILSDLAASSDRRVSYLLALAGDLSFAQAAERLATTGWRARAPEKGEPRGVIGHLLPPTGPPEVDVLQGRFADVLAASDVVLGLAGTANEQAAGLGKPIVTFVGRGRQHTRGFVRTQKKLLGEAVSVVERDPQVVAHELLDILGNPARQMTMGQAGRKRMGGPGGAGRIAAAIKNMLFTADKDARPGDQ
ncbi:MAG: lipid-A-disaccharide synthase-related protein [Bacteroidota bacterium]